MVIKKFFTDIVISFITAFIITLYLSKFKSIMFGVSIESYLIYMLTLTVCYLKIYYNTDFRKWIRVVFYKDLDKKQICNNIYFFSKKHYLEEDKETLSYVKNNVRHKGLIEFFVRFIDNNTDTEIEEFITIQKNLLSEKKISLKKVVTYNYVFIGLALSMSYIYDSNIKGLLLISSILMVLNTISLKKIDKFILDSALLINLYENIYKDILNYQNPKYVLFKSENILMLSVEEVNINNIEEKRNYIKKMENLHPTEDIVKNNKNNININHRKSNSITIRSKKSQLNKDKQIIINN